MLDHLKAQDEIESAVGDGTVVQIGSQEVHFAAVLRIRHHPIDAHDHGAFAGETRRSVTRARSEVEHTAPCDARARELIRGEVHREELASLVQAFARERDVFAHPESPCRRLC